MKSYFIPLMLLFMAAGCSGSSEQRSIPRRTAYPRPQLPDTVMVEYAAAPLRFYINVGAYASEPRPGWLDIRYPMLGATIHVTFTPATAATIDEIRRNRMERLILNAGDLPSTHSEFSNNAGFDVLIANTDGATTPIQFLASDGSAWVVSGAAYFDNPDATKATDSIRPMLDVLRRDITRALTQISEK